MIYYILPTPPLPNSASWLFNPTTQPTTNPSSSRMYVLKKHLDTINLEQNKYKDDNDDFEWKYNDSYDYLKNEDIEPYDKMTLIVCYYFGILHYRVILI